MKIRAFCSKCLDSYEPYSDAWFEFTKIENVYQIKCVNDHSTDIYISNEPFDLLYSLGINALSRGSYTEAIINFSASIERYYEFSNKLMCKINDVDPSDFDTAYKSIGKNSTQELSAFIMLYLITVKKIPYVLSNKEKSLRNNIVHQGKIANRDDALSFGQSVYDIINPDYSLYRQNYQKLLSEIHKERWKKIYNSIEKNIGSFGIYSFLSQSEFYRIEAMVKVSVLIS